MAEIERKTKRYPTDPTDEEWSRIEPSPPKPGRTGRRRRCDPRKVLNAIRSMTRSGGGWRMLPKDFPPWRTVSWWFRRFVRLMLFRTIHDIAPMLVPRDAARGLLQRRGVGPLAPEGGPPRRHHAARRYPDELRQPAPARRGREGGALRFASRMIRSPRGEPSWRSRSGREIR
jgi:transposase